METAIVDSKLKLVNNELWSVRSIIDKQDIDEYKKQRLDSTLLKIIGYTSDLRQMLESNNISKTS